MMIDRLTSIQAGNRVYLDTNIWIYALEGFAPFARCWGRRSPASMPANGRQSRVSRPWPNYWSNRCKCAYFSPS